MDYEYNEKRYVNERKARTKTGVQGEKKLSKYLTSFISKTFNTDAQLVRYDVIWQKAYPLNGVNKERDEWIKGCPDYYIRTDKGFYYIEIKTKNNKPFYLTIKGVDSNKCKNGSIIPKYGCASNYLDIEPVYKNMIDFCKNANISLNNFLIVYSKEDCTDLRIISLQTVKDMESYGVRNRDGDVVELGRYSGGYGIKVGKKRALSFLIPEDCMVKLKNKKIVDYLQKRISSTISLPNRI